jgi:flagellar L-ring protein precursor FlgH
MASLVMSKRAAGSVSGSAEDILGDNKISTDHSFKGEGTLEKSNEMKGFVTVTVERVFPNGNLFITGQKRVETDGGEEFVRLRGIIRPEDIKPDNTTISTRVAQAEIGFVAAGDRYDMATQGWLGRFFNRVDPL